MMEKNNNTKNLKTEKSDTTIKETNNQIKVLNIDNIDGSTFQTKKKSFISEINPHLIRRNIQKEQYIWFGVFDELLRNKCMLKAIKKCRETSLPLVKIKIKIKIKN
jgi:hypothetical protein